jgi:hypothetical protein
MCEFFQKKCLHPRTHGCVNRKIIDECTPERIKAGKNNLQQGKIITTRRASVAKLLI